MFRRVLLPGILAAAIGAVALTGVAAGGRADDSVFAGNWQTTRGPLLLRSYSSVVDWGEYGENPIGRVCGVHVSPTDDPTALELSGYWYEGGPVFTPSSDIECGNIHGSPWGRFFFKISSDGKSFTGAYETSGDGLPIGNTSRWPVWNGTRAGPAGGKTVSTLPTSNKPFGTAVTGPVALGGVVDVPSPSLPASTTEVDLNAEFSDADVTQLAAALKVALAAYNRRKLLDALSYYCLVFVPNGSSYQLGLNDFDAVPGACDKFAASLLKKKAYKPRLPAAANGGCAVAFVPFWKAGTRVTAQQHSMAAAVARSEVKASCTSTQSGRLALKVTARGTTTLNQVLGKSAQAGIGASSVAGGSTQLTVSWAPPHRRTAPSAPSGKAKAGHYAGFTGESKSISFDVTADRAGVTNLHVAGKVTCADSTQWTWTFSSGGSNPVSSSLGFSHAYAGPLKIAGNTVTNINVSYALKGSLTGAGAASGSFQVKRITWDQNGKHYDCTGVQVGWTAKLGG
jgi:hypothetical protein